MFERGVSFYTKGIVTLEVNFPENQVMCRWCGWCRAEKEVNRHWCRLTNSLLYSIDAIGEDCPIKFIKDERED